MLTGLVSSKTKGAKDVASGGTTVTVSDGGGPKVTDPKPPSRLPASPPPTTNPNAKGTNTQYRQPQGSWVPRSTLGHRSRTVPARAAMA